MSSQIPENKSLKPSSVNTLLCLLSHTSTTTDVGHTKLHHLGLTVRPISSLSTPFSKGLSSFSTTFLQEIYCTVNMKSEKLSFV